MDKTIEKSNKNGCVTHYVSEEGETVFCISGELDHHSVKPMREEIDAVIIDNRPKNVVIDLAGVTFTDSAGLGLVLGRYTRISGYGGKVKLVSVSDEFMKILRLAGVERFMEIEQRTKK